MSAESYELNLKFLVLGPENSGKTLLISRVADGVYPEYLHGHHSRPLGVNYKSKTVTLDNQKIKCILFDDNFNGEKCREQLRSKKGVLLTVDMTDEDALEKTTNWINSVGRDGVEKTPILIIGTKADDKIKQRISEAVLTQFVQECNAAGASVFGPRITSARIGIGTDHPDFLTFASKIVIENHPALKAEITTKNTNIKNKILPELEAYTSGFNKFIAWLKAIFSLGQFTLGLKKQDKAEELKAALDQPGANASRLVESYKQENEKLVIHEFLHSSLFVKPYIKLDLLASSVVEIKRNDGKLGEILNKYSNK